MSKKIIPLAIAAALACLVMVVAGAVAFSGAVAAERSPAASPGNSHTTPPKA